MYRCVVCCIQKWKPSPAVIIVDNHATNSAAFFSKESDMYIRTRHNTTTTSTTVLNLAITTALLRTLHIEILLLPHAVVWHCTHAHRTEGVAGEASKEAIDFQCSLERTKL